MRTPRPHGTMQERFWRFVTRGDTNGCWEWQGYRDKNGYGKMAARGTNIAAHRVSFEIHNGCIDPALMVLHKCNNPPCCNPNHLYQGTQKQNMVDRAESGNAPIGEGHFNCLYSEDVVSAVRSAEGTYTNIADRFGMSRSHVRNIKKGIQRNTVAASPSYKRSQHATKLKGRTVTWGDKLADAIRKLTVDEAAAVKLRLDSGEKVKDLAAEYGMHRTTISKIKKGNYFEPYRKNKGGL